VNGQGPMEWPASTTLPIQFRKADGIADARIVTRLAGSNSARQDEQRKAAGPRGKNDAWGTFYHGVGSVRRHADG